MTDSEWEDWWARTAPTLLEYRLAVRHSAYAHAPLLRGYPPGVLVTQKYLTLDLGPSLSSWFIGPMYPWG